MALDRTSFLLGCLMWGDDYTLVRCPVCMGTGEQLSMVGHCIGDCPTCKGLYYVRVKKKDFAIYEPDSKGDDEPRVQ